MLFNSLQFLVFFLIVVSLYFLVKSKYRWMLLLVASYYFYMCWNPGYILLIILSTCVDYFAGLKMGEKETKEERKKYLVLSVCMNLGLLFVFKYYNFFFDSFAFIMERYGIAFSSHKLNLLLPVGISFYTFQTLSYSIDV